MNEFTCNLDKELVTATEIQRKRDLAQLFSLEPDIGHEEYERRLATNHDYF